MPRFLKGNIARLPAAVRMQVNLKLRDNVPSPEIIAWLFKEHAAALTALGIKRLTRNNLWHWRHSGYKDWELLQERLEEMRVQREVAFEIARHSDGTVEAANLAIAAGQIYEVMQDFDIRQLKTKLRKHPELYSLLIDGVAKLSRAGVGERKLQLEFTKYQDKVAEQKRKIEAELGKAKGGGLTPETIAKIEEALNLM